MRQKTSNINVLNRYGGIKGSCTWILLLFTVYAYNQELVVKKISSEFQKIVIELDRVDHIELINSDSDSEIMVKAEGSIEVSSFRITESNGHVLIKEDQYTEDESEFDKDKACGIVPDFTSYQIFIPQNRTVYVSFLEGNFYSEEFNGELDIKVEDGILRLKEMEDTVKVQLNTGSIFVHQIKNTKIDAETNRGILVTDISNGASNSGMKRLQQSIGHPDNDMWIRAILANIYLYESKD